jgi:hypothetical protein
VFDTQAQVYYFFDLAEKNETRGKKYNHVANAFFSWVSFLKRFFRNSDKYSGEPELCCDEHCSVESESMLPQPCGFEFRLGVNVLT